MTPGIIFDLYVYLCAHRMCTHKVTTCAQPFLTALDWVMTKFSRVLWLLGASGVV